MNPSTSLGTTSNVGMAKPSPSVRQAGNIRGLLVIRGGCRRSVSRGCAQAKYRCRCRAKGSGNKWAVVVVGGRVTMAPPTVEPTLTTRLNSAYLYGLTL